MVGRRVMAKVIIFKGNKLIEREIKLDSPFPLGDLLDKIDVSREEVGFAICKSDFISMDDLVNPDDEVRILSSFRGRLKDYVAKCTLY
ncbi:molybdenum cofactor biosynthesis protein [Acetomicrobium sp.]|uniref:molybdenum cofactor biosynthesis protein n=1 Tax=Acetomicrobium sp. TaxID=1872099 RepID=UPI0028718607|nr:molybdenum cofactor biosynthesis protein [Acetomicrobium sp.]MDR9770052.1 molybdenum cofactor biosynthesis protein [Acetomicrobium sp.]